MAGTLGDSSTGHKPKAAEHHQAQGNELPLDAWAQAAGAAYHKGQVWVDNNILRPYVAPRNEPPQPIWNGLDPAPVHPPWKDIQDLYETLISRPNEQQRAVFKGDSAMDHAYE